MDPVETVKEREGGVKSFRASKTGFQNRFDFFPSQLWWKNALVLSLFFYGRQTDKHL